MATEAQLSDEEIVDGSDFEEFVAVEFPRIIALGIALLRDEDDARDAAQETMARVLRNWAEVASLDKPGAWARRVALNLITDMLRRRTRRWRVQRRLVNEPTTHVSAHDDELLDRALWDHVAELPSRQREVVALFYIDDMSVADIADTIGVPSGTVKSDLSRARNRLRALLSKEEP